MDDKFLILPQRVQEAIEHIVNRRIYEVLQIVLLQTMIVYVMPEGETEWRAEERKVQGIDIKTGGGIPVLREGEYIERTMDGRVYIYEEA